MDDMLSITDEEMEMCEMDGSKFLQMLEALGNDASTDEMKDFVADLYMRAADRVKG